MRLVALAFVVVFASACSCGTGNVTIGGKKDGGAGGSGGSTGGGTGGANGGGTGGGTGGGVNFNGTLVISPRDVMLDLINGQPAPTQQFTALADGQPVNPTWSLVPTGNGTIDAAGLFTASAVGGRATLQAAYGSASDSTTVTVRLSVTQNGGTGGQDAGAGGFGGVGGEGEGGPVDPTTLAVLNGTPTGDGSTWLYPYDRTVWPKDLLPPLLMWQPMHSYDAVRISLSCPNFHFVGTFAKTATPFLHHPIPRAAWQQVSALCAGEDVTAQLVFAAQGQAWGPLTETWHVANGSLKGVVYYNSYGTKLAKNYSGALGPDPTFGGATLAIRGTSTDPVLVAGGNGTEAQCRVCHVVSADGSTLLTQQGTNYAGTSAYALRNGNAETPMSPGDGRYAWGGISPDGTLLFSNVSTLAGSAGGSSALFRVPSGAAVSSTGLPSGLGAATPSFSADGKLVAFNVFAGPGADQRSLATLKFTLPATFSDYTPVFTPPAGTAVFPSFLPTGAGVVFELETLSNGRFGETRSTCDDPGPCSSIGTRAELWWVELASKQAHRLDKLNGAGYLPTGPDSHGDDATLNYEPTVGPIASGGYAWVIFTSRRLYGNVAVINPWWSDPRWHDIHATPTTKKLWVAAIDLNAAPGTDPSHPAFYLPAQELLAGNSRGYWSADPCKNDGLSCGSGDECCNGYCSENQCSSTPSTGTDGGTCAKEFDRCTTDRDCCDVTAICAAGHCATIR
ncbi:MAG: hypothetical protein U0228_04980 [Myxococcaceae bacterium]